MMDYTSRIIDLMQICEDMHGDVNTLLAPVWRHGGITRERSVKISWE
jgi:hypothetical protein